MEDQVITSNTALIKAANENTPLGPDTVWVYATGTSEDGPIKVGISSYPHYRIHELQAGCPDKLFLMFRAPFENRAAAYAKEQDVHGCFDIIHGEWLDTHIEAVIDILQDCCDTAMWEEINNWGRNK